MSIKKFSISSLFNVPVETLFDWHRQPGAINRMIPPWQDVSVESAEGIEDGNRTVLRIRVPGTPFRQKWIARHIGFEEYRSFSDIQEEGPFAHWKHVREFEPDGSGSRLTENIEFKLPFAFVSHPFLARGFQSSFQRAFEYRHRVLADDLQLLTSEPQPPLRILLTGSTGMIGRVLVSFLRTAGHSVVKLRRGNDRTGSPGEIYWSHESGFADPSQLEGIQAVVHLAGENISGGRWTRSRKKKILDSRTQLTGQLASALAQLAEPPEVFISASAMGYYGRTAHQATEESPPGDDFLAEVCKQWEAAAAPAEEAGIRVVHPRTGIVLSPSGGALQKMLLPMMMFAGGKIGKGDQMMSWITLDDVISLIYHAIINPHISGPVNFVTPNPVSNRDFTATLAEVVRRTDFATVPSPVIRLLFGEMGASTVLADQEIIPEKLLRSGYTFRYPHLESALRHVLGRV